MKILYLPKWVLQEKCVQVQRLFTDTEDSIRPSGQGFSAWIKHLLPKYDVAYVHCYTIFNRLLLGTSPNIFIGWCARELIHIRYCFWLLVFHHGFIIFRKKEICNYIFYDHLTLWRPYGELYVLYQTTVDGSTAFFTSWKNTFKKRFIKNRKMHQNVKLMIATVWAFIRAQGTVIFFFFFF